MGNFRRRFWPLFATQFLGAFNDNLFKNALVIMITYRSVSLMGLGAAELVALSGAIFTFPFFLFSGLAGEMADNFERSRLIQIIKIAEIIIMGLGVVGLWLDSYGFLLFVLFLMGAQSAFFGPLKYGTLPDLVGEKALVRANALTSAGTFVAILLGTILGGLLASFDLSLWPLSLALLVVALIGAVTSFGIVKLPAHSNEKVPLALIRPIGKLYRLCRRDAHIWQALLSISWFWLFGVVILAVIPTLGKDIFFGAEMVSTFFLMLFTLGMGIGAWVADRVGRGRAELGLVPISTLAMSIFLFDLAFVSSMAIPRGELITLKDFLSEVANLRACFDLLMLSVFGGTYIVSLMSYIQSQSRPHEVSRIIAGNNIFNSVSMVLGSVLLMAGYTLGFSVVQMMIFFGALNLFVSLILYKRLSEHAIRLWAVLISSIFYRVKIEGRENLPTQGPFIIASNHVSFVDWLLIMSVSPFPVRFVIDHRYYFARGLPFWLRQAKLIPIATRKERAELTDQAFTEISKALEQGDIVGIFPEGSLTRTGEIRPFQPGLTWVVKKNPVAVVPLRIEGLWGSFFSHSSPGVFRKWPSILRRRRVIISIYPAVAAENYQLRELHSIISRTRGDS